MTRGESDGKHRLFVSGVYLDRLKRAAEAVGVTAEYDEANGQLLLTFPDRDLAQVFFDAATAADPENRAQLFEGDSKKEGDKR